MDKINFILENIPDLYNKTNNSNLYIILNSLSKELNTFVTSIEDVRNAKFVDYATSSDLDKIASILNLKRFNNESDDLFRVRVKSRVTSFVGGGAISALKQVINTYLGADPVIIEHYKPGAGHPYFDNGVLSNLECIINDSQSVKIKSGVAYSNGVRINTVTDLILTLNAYETNCIFLRNDGTLYIQNEVRDTTFTSINFDTNIAEYTAGNIYTFIVQSDYYSNFDNIVDNIKIGIDYVTDAGKKFGKIKSLDKVNRTITIEVLYNYSDASSSSWTDEGITIINSVSYPITPETTDILLYNIENYSSTIYDVDIVDKRLILDPEQHYITNIASITIQIPYNFEVGNISLEDVKNILRHTKAAGIALLIKIMDTYSESMQLTETAHSYFLMGFSGIGGNNILGGIV